MIAALLAAALATASPAVQRLQTDLAANDSATAVLQARCDRMAPRGTRMRARQVAAPADAKADAAARRDLAVGRAEPLRHRRVELACAGRILSRADNWYLPGRLTAEMNATLETTETPFGVVVRPLGFHRRTIASTVLAGPDVLRNRATLATSDGRPFSLVVETYTDAALAP